MTERTLDELLAIAAKASAGPWMVATDLPAYAIMALNPDGTGGHRVVQTPNQNNYRRFGSANAWDGISSVSNADFIAAFNPALVTDLINRLKAAEATRPAAVEDGPGEWRTADILPIEAGNYWCFCEAPPQSHSMQVLRFNKVRGTWLTSWPVRYWRDLPAPPSPTEGEAR